MAQSAIAKVNYVLRKAEKVQSKKNISLKCFLNHLELTAFVFLVTTCSEEGRKRWVLNSNLIGSQPPHRFIAISNLVQTSLILILPDLWKSGLEAEDAGWGTLYVGSFPACVLFPGCCSSLQICLVTWNITAAHMVPRRKLHCGI